MQRLPILSSCLAAVVTLGGPLGARQEAPQSHASGSDLRRPDQSDHEQFAKAAIDRWEKFHEESKCAVVTLRSHRTQIDRDLSNNEGAPEVKYDIVVRARAVMKTEAHWLEVWEETGNEHVQGGQPALSLECRNGLVWEKVWQPATMGYRTQKYVAPLPTGTDDTEYEHACQIGSFLQTWLGDTDLVNHFLTRMRQSTIRSETQIISGQECFELRFAGPRSEHPDGSTYQFVETYFIRSDGQLLRWQTVATGTAGSKASEVKQVRDYDFTYYTDVPKNLGVRRNEGAGDQNSKQPPHSDSSATPD